MQLTRYTDYSLRVLMYLALRPDRLATIDEIAGAYGISRAHLMKVAHRLGVAGFIETTRGRGGGLRLARAAEEIRIGDVVRQTEGQRPLVECFAPEVSDCCIAPACGLRGVLGEALHAFLARLDEHTLADVVSRRRSRLIHLLEAP